MIRELLPSEYHSIVGLGCLIRPNFSLSLIGENDRILAYFDEEKIVGFISYYRSYETIDILYIAVSLTKRRQKVASKLIDYLSSIEGLKHLMLEVKRTNREAIEFYKASGFRVIREIKNYYGVEDALSMERSIL